MKEPGFIEYTIDRIQFWLLNTPYSLYDIMLGHPLTLWDKTRYFLLTGRIWR